MFKSLIGELREAAHPVRFPADDFESVAEGSGSRYSKADRQDAFLGGLRRDKKQQRDVAREKHGHPDEIDSVFPNTKEGRVTRPGHGSSMDKVRHAIFNRKFKYSDKYKRSVVGPKGKLPG